MTDAVHGTLLGVVIGERLNGASAPDALGVVAGNELTVAERLAPHGGPP